MLRVTPARGEVLPALPVIYVFIFHIHFSYGTIAGALARVAGVKSGPERAGTPAHPALRPDHERASGQEIAVCPGEFFHYLSTARV